MSYESCDPKTARTLQEQGWLYIDVRCPEEFVEGHPEGSVNIPILLLEPQGPTHNPRFLDAVVTLYAQGTPLLLGCKAGWRSAQACELLAASGYTRLANVEGGYHGSASTPGWLEEGLPTSVSGTSWEAVRAQLG